MRTCQHITEGPHSDPSCFQPRYNHCCTHSGNEVPGRKSRCSRASWSLLLLIFYNGYQDGEPSTDSSFNCNRSTVRSENLVKVANVVSYALNEHQPAPQEFKLFIAST
ncbi:hypothetical protein MLD38_022643 [Melastoma candidum]|uniref:Uncharacterized protein n=1 Tax=Melastoma candidum TaxID=119954 RepID=A0ACB9QJV7_9MYRT|nr:hypothetical protein MLD38_022643 [Melastoma candidum]